MAPIHRLEPENVAEKCAVRFGVFTVDNYVSARNHLPLQRNPHIIKGRPFYIASRSRPFERPTLASDSTSTSSALIKHVDCASPTFTAIDYGSRMLVAGWLWRGLGGTASGSGTFYWVGLIVEADYILSDVGGGEE